MKMSGVTAASLVALSLSLFSLRLSIGADWRASAAERRAHAANLPRRLQYAYAFYGGVAWGLQMHMAGRIPGRVSTMAACDSAFTADSSYIATRLP